MEVSPHNSLNSLLPVLLSSKDEDNKSLMISALNLLKDVCKIHSKSSSSEVADAARNISIILKDILEHEGNSITEIDDDEAENFIKSEECFDTQDYSAAKEDNVIDAIYGKREIKEKKTVKKPEDIESDKLKKEKTTDKEKSIYVEQQEVIELKEEKLEAIELKEEKLAEELKEEKLEAIELKEEKLAEELNEEKLEAIELKEEKLAEELNEEKLEDIELKEEKLAEELKKENLAEVEETADSQALEESEQSDDKTEISEDTDSNEFEEEFEDIKESKRIEKQDSSKENKIIEESKKPKVIIEDRIEEKKDQAEEDDYDKVIFKEVKKSGKSSRVEILSIVEVEDKSDDEIEVVASPPHPLPELADLLDEWNKEMPEWFQINLGKDEARVENILISFLNSASALRCNLATAAMRSNTCKEHLKKFKEYWTLWLEAISKESYEIFPSKFGKTKKPVGNVIYSSRPKLNKQENIIISPGLRKEEDIILSPLTFINLPIEQDFPNDHMDKDFPVYWRAILGELELLIYHINIQQSVYCSIESVNKINVDPLHKCKENLLNEIIRRGNALRSAILKKESIYRIATNYWRLEECFWGVFHDDGRRQGYSFFDRLRRRVQRWRTYIRKEHQLYIRDFSPLNDSLAAVNKYIGNIVFTTQKGVAPGIVLRQLRPAILVKVKNITRVLKGRVIAT